MIYLVNKSIKNCLISDQKISMMLSGGVDSNIIFQVMKNNYKLPFTACSVLDANSNYDESKNVNLAIKEFKGDHLVVDNSEIVKKNFLDEVKKRINFYSAPILTISSYVSSFLQEEISNNGLKVNISGVGADELFGGYNRYFKTHQWWDKINVIPKSARKLMSRGLLSISPGVWDRTGIVLKGVSGNNISKLAGVLSVPDDASLYRHFTSHWDDPAAVVIDGQELRTEVSHPSIALNSRVEQMMGLDTLTYLPDDILTKVDRAAMGVSLETRIPLLDYRVVEFAWKLPLSMKIRNGQGKWILRELLYQYVPKELIERQKMGFGVPIDSWLRGPLRGWAESLLDESRLRQEGYFYPQLIRKKWEEHISGRRNWQYHLWDVLMFQAWLEEQS